MFLSSVLITATLIVTSLLHISVPDTERQFDTFRQ